MTDIFDAVVVGAGHAGCEAALALSRMGHSTLLTTMNLDAVALMPCNPAIGGTAKGHLVREVDALGGEMGRAIDDAFIQSRMLNTGKGPAVYSLRAQADKRAYQQRMRGAIEDAEGLELRQTEVASIEVKNGRVKAVLTTTGSRIECRAVIVAGGVYLNSRIIIGECAWSGGPQGLLPAQSLAASLEDLGFALRRFKTGTPARVDGRTLNYDQMIPQPGDEPVVPFSFMTDEPLTNRALCYLTYTNETTHAVIRENLHRAPMYAGAIKGTGARYCPSIEDKVVRFADKDRHPVFLEPEGLSTVEWYVQGMSTSMPEDVQRAIYHSIPGLENARILRLAYAIEYEVIDSTRLNAQLGAKEIEGLYFAGQINGTSGYEEAAAQGIYAGINAALWLGDREPMLLTRADAYTGVMVDDLVTKGVDEPYRMMTSRAEYRLMLRQDNADLRLTEMSRRAGLADENRYLRMLEKREQAAQTVKRLNAIRVPVDDDLRAMLREKDGGDAPANSATIAELLRRPGVHYADLAGYDILYSDTMPAAREQAEIAIKYEGYLARQQSQIHKFERAENLLIPEDIDYLSIDALRIEARIKLDAKRPRSLGAASRIPGVSPGDVSVLMVVLERARRQRAQRGSGN